MESNMEARTLTYVNRQPTGTCSMTRELKVGPWDNLQGWGWAAGRKETQEGGTNVHLCLIYVDDRNQMNTVKQPSIKNKY